MPSLVFLTAWAKQNLFAFSIYLIAADRHAPLFFLFLNVMYN